MIADSKVNSGFAVKDVEEAKAFYGDTLGIEITMYDEENGLFALNHKDGRDTLVYRKDDHVPATYTILNFTVDDIEGAVDDLAGKGIEFERYEGFEQDERGIAHGPGPQIAWFKDPSGNILSVLQEP